MNRRPVVGWNPKVNGLRRPSAQIDWFGRTAVAKNGLSAGTAPSGAMRRIFPSRFAIVCAFAAVRVVAHGDVQLAVGPEVNRAAVVVGRGRQGIELEDHRLAAGGRDVAGGGEAADAVVRRRAGHRVVDVDERVAGEGRVEGDPDQAPLAGGIHRQREERRGQQRPVLDDAHAPRLLADEDAAVGRDRHRGRAGDAAGDEHLGKAGRKRGGGGRRRDGEGDRTRDERVQHGSRQGPGRGHGHLLGGEDTTLTPAAGEEEVARPAAPGACQPSRSCKLPCCPLPAGSACPLGTPWFASVDSLVASRFP